MIRISEVHHLDLSRNTVIALSPVVFLLLMIIWTVFTMGLPPVQAAGGVATAPVFAVVQRSSANLRQGPGTEYSVLGTVRKGALLPVSGQIVNAIGERWYRVYLRALGNVWISSMVVNLSPANADIPLVSLNTPTAPAQITLPQIDFAQQNGGSSNANAGSGSSPTSVPQQPTPVTTPDPGA